MKNTNIDFSRYLRPPDCPRLRPYAKLVAQAAEIAGEWTGFAMDRTKPRPLIRLSFSIHPEHSKAIGLLDGAFMDFARKAEEPATLPSVSELTGSLEGLVERLKDVFGSGIDPAYGAKEIEADMAAVRLAIRELGETATRMPIDQAAVDAAVRRLADTFEPFAARARNIEDILAPTRSRRDLQGEMLHAIKTGNEGVETLKQIGETMIAKADGAATTDDVRRIAHGVVSNLGKKIKQSKSKPSLSASEIWKEGDEPHYQPSEAKRLIAAATGLHIKRISLVMREFEDQKAVDELEKARACGRRRPDFNRFGIHRGMCNWPRSMLDSFLGHVRDYRRKFAQESAETCILFNEWYNLTLHMERAKGDAKVATRKRLDDAISRGRVKPVASVGSTKAEIALKEQQTEAYRQSGDDTHSFDE